MKTWGDLLVEITDVLQDPLLIHWGAAELLRYANNTASDIARHSRHRRRPLAINVIAGQATYRYADMGLDDVLELLPDTVIFDNRRGLELLTPADMPPNWQTRAAAEPHGYLLNINGYPGLTLYPRPSADALTRGTANGAWFDPGGGIVLDIEGIGDTAFDGEFGPIVGMEMRLGGVQATYISGKADPMTDASSLPDIPTGYERALKLGVWQQAFEKQGRFRSPQLASHYGAQFQRELESIGATVSRDWQGPSDRPARLSFY